LTFSGNVTAAAAALSMSFAVDALANPNEKPADPVGFPNNEELAFNEFSSVLDDTFVPKPPPLLLAVPNPELLLPNALPNPPPDELPKPPLVVLLLEPNTPNPEKAEPPPKTLAPASVAFESETVSLVPAKGLLLGGLDPLLAEGLLTLRILRFDNTSSEAF